MKILLMKKIKSIFWVLVFRVSDSCTALGNEASWRGRYVEKITEMVALVRQGEGTRRKETKTKRNGEEGRRGMESVKRVKEGMERCCPRAQLAVDTAGMLMDVLRSPPQTPLKLCQTVTLSPLLHLSLIIINNTARIPFPLLETYMAAVFFFFI